MTTEQSPLSEAELEALERGLESVTPGPWTDARSVVTSQTARHASTYSLEDEQPDRKAVAYCGDEIHARMGLPFGNERDANAAHIARCDPQTISRLIAEVRRSRTGGAGEARGQRIDMPPSDAGFRDGVPVEVGYTNWRGEHGIRHIIPLLVWFGATDWHPEPQWLLSAFDLDKDAMRDFAISDLGRRPPLPEDGGAGGVAVKPLVWEVDQVGGGLMAGEYRLRAGLWTHGYYWLRGNDEPHTGYSDEDEAKAAAQADYEQRIRSALAPSGAGGATRIDRLLASPPTPIAAAEPAGTPVVTEEMDTLGNSVIALLDAFAEGYRETGDDARWAMSSVMADKVRAALAFSKGARNG